MLIYFFSDLGLVNLGIIDRLAIMYAESHSRGGARINIGKGKGRGPALGH